MDLITPKRRRLHSTPFDGVGTSARNVLYIPLKIIRFEINESVLHLGKKMLTFQADYIDKNGVRYHRPVMTESFTLINTISGTESELPHYTKIIRKRDGYFYFVKLNDIEKSQLINI